MTTPLRRLYGGSNRKHHLRISSHAAAALMALAAVNPGATVLGYWVQMPNPALWIVAGVACYGHECWATADRDEQEKRLPKTAKGWAKRTLAERLDNWYWWAFGYIPHRNILSHGPIIGTIARVLYGWWPLLLGLGLLWDVSPFWAAWLGVALGVGWLVNDAFHLLLDL